MTGDLVKDLTARVADLTQWVNDLQSGMFINCVYCGHRYGPAQSTADAIPRAGETMAEALRQHVETCPKHPMAKLAAEKAELQALLDMPETIDFVKAVQLEAAHQRKRWGSDHDAGKTDADWFWLIGYLAGKAVNKPEKQLHHIITTAAACANWHAQKLGASNMRPGIEAPAGEG